MADAISTRLALAVIRRLDPYPQFKDLNPANVISWDISVNPYGRTTVTIELASTKEERHLTV